MIFMKKFLGIFIIIFTIFLLGCEGQAEKENEVLSKYNENKLLKVFKNEFPERKVILCESADLTNDNIEDLIVIFKEEKETRMVVLVDSGDGVKYTNIVPAPIEDQSIKLKNIDNKDEMEFIVSGSKRGNIGYAIFRIENMKIVDLFGEGMDSCC